MVFRSYFKLPAAQTNQENCVSHLPSLVPVPGRDIIVQAWYQGGVSVIDFTDSANPREIALANQLDGEAYDDLRGRCAGSPAGSSRKTGRRRLAWAPPPQPAVALGSSIARAQLIGPSLAAALLLAVGAGCHADQAAEIDAPTAPTQRFVSRPDLRPPQVEIAQAPGDTAPGSIFLAPKRAVEQAGPLILDERGEVVWFRPLDAEGVTDFRVQSYDGRPVLTWWRGQSEQGIGDGHFVILDNSYREIATITAGNGLTGDIHEFLITERDTALLLVYDRLPRDLSGLGGPAEGSIWEGIVQEIDIPSGRVLFEWRSSEHVEVDESYAKVPSADRGADADAYDYFHVNSVAEDDDGDLLVSARNTHAIYKVARVGGEVLWRLGGKRSDFELGPGVRFAWQHDARRQPDGTLTLFDNVAAEEDAGGSSRALALELDEAAMRATLARSYEHPDGLLSTTQGNAQFLADGHVFVGWGSQPFFTEFARDGRVLLSGRFGARNGETDSYRAYRFSWTGRPAADPTLVLRPGEDDRHVAYASWNGATEVALWQLLAGADPQHLRPVATATPDGFETAIPVETGEPVVQARALNARGAVLGTSAPVTVDGRDD